MKTSRNILLSAGIALLLFAAGCTSTGSIGLLSDSETETDLGPHDSHVFHRVGHPIEGRACRHFILGIIPWGDSDLESAMRDAFKKNPSLHADGLVHVATSTSLYNFFPLYNVYTLTCTTVRGTPIRFDHSPTKPGVSPPSSSRHMGKKDSSGKS
ncbi:MAG: hypothetical protein ACP5OP_01685 [Leptospirillia bacterium]